MAPSSSSEGAKSRFSCETCHFEGYVDGRTHHTGRGDVRATTKPLVGLFNNRPHFSRALDPDLTTVPYLSTGATDSARLRTWGMQAFGLLPFPMNQDDEDRMHGNDERVPLASLEFGTKLVYGAVARVAR